MKCSYCSEDFSPKRSTAKFCSAKCRVYDKRTNVYTLTKQPQVLNVLSYPKPPAPQSTRLRPAIKTCKNGHALDWRGKCFGRGCKYA